MKKQCSTVLFLLIIFLFLVFLPISMVFFNVDKNIIILTITFGGIFFLFWCFFCFLIPQKDLKKYIHRLIAGDIGLEPPKKRFFSSIQSVENLTVKFVEDTLNSLLNDLKMEILHTQDSSDVFLEEVQWAVTNSSRISLGADYIDSRVENLDKLLGESIKENAETQKSIDAFTKQLESQTSSIIQTGEVIENIANELKISINNLDNNKLISENVIAVTEECGAKIKETVKGISKISDAINVANGTIEIVDNIAQQTNLLAMNAAIEAAHAGEAGKGFAVVATEIRKLAETTSKQVKSITDSLQSVIDIVGITTNLGNDTGTAFAGISTQIDKFIKVFDNVINDFSNLGDKNKLIYMDFEKIKSMNNVVAEKMDGISKKIEENNNHLEQIHLCSEEIKTIVQRNATESIQLSKGQVPVYKNVIENAKHLEQIRKNINAFRVKNVPLEVWESDKTELNLLIEALYHHLEWTVAMLKFIHGEEDSLKNQLALGTTEFDKWFYNHACKKYENHPSIEKIKNIGVIMHEKAVLIGKLKEAGKAQSATIEFSEILDQSRFLREELNHLKKYIIKESINKKNDTQEKELSAETEKTVEKPNNEIESFMRKPQEVQLVSLEKIKLQQEKIQEVEELEEFEELEEI